MAKCGNLLQLRMTVVCVGAILTFLSAPLVAASQGQDSVIDRLERMEATINTINSDVEGIIKARNSASLNAAVCISTGVGTALKLEGKSEAGARWDVAVLGDIHVDLNAGITGDSTMAANVCINVPLVSIGETAIPTGESRLKLVGEDGREVLLTAAETKAFEDSLIQASSELQDMGLAMGGSMAQLMEELKPAEVLSPSNSPLLDPGAIVGALPDVLIDGTVGGTPFADLPLAADAEATMKAFINNMNPCTLMQDNPLAPKFGDIEVERLICDGELLDHLDIIDKIWDTVNTILGKIKDLPF